MATARAIRQAYDARFSDLRLNLSEASLLSFVAERKPLTQSRLAECLGLGRAVTGCMVDNLQERGLVERLANPDDGRAWLVTVTPLGQEMVEQIAARDQVLRGELRDGIGRADRQQLAVLLIRLGRNLASVLDEEEDHFV